MIKLIKNNNINKTKWDTCIASSSNPSVFGYSWYLEAVCDDWCGLVLNDYEAVFPLAIKSKYKIDIIYQPFFTRYYGLFTKAKISSQQLNEFLESIPSNFKLIDFGIDWNEPIESNKFEFLERHYQLLDLKNPYDVLTKSYSENTKRNIKKAIKAELSVREGIASEEIVNLFKRTKGEELEVFKIEDYEKLLRLMHSFENRKMSESYSVYDSKNKLLAAAFFMKSHECYTYLKSGVSDEGKSLGAMHLIMDAFIEKHANTSTMLDFGGSSVESVARFYKNFGAKDCVYLQVKKDTLPKIVKWVKKIKK